MGFEMDDLGGATLAPHRSRRADALVRPPASRPPFSIARALAKDVTSSSAAADGGELSLLDPSALSWVEEEAEDANGESNSGDRSHGGR